MASTQLTTRKQGGDVLNQVLLTSAPQSPMLDQRIGPTEPTQPHQSLRQKGVRPDARHRTWYKQIWAEY